MNKMSFKCVSILVAALCLLLFLADQVSAQSSSTSPSTGGSLSTGTPGSWVQQGIAEQGSGGPSISTGTTPTDTPSLFMSILEQLFTFFATILQNFLTGLNSWLTGAAAG